MDITYSSPLALAKVSNSFAQCRALRCVLKRSSLNSYCPAHQTRWMYYGDPTGQPIPKKSWASYRGPVSDLFRGHADHPGLIQALRYLDDLTTRACERPSSTPAGSELDRLKRQGVTSMDLLTELCAFWCFITEHPRGCKTELARDFAISRALFGLAPRPSRVLSTNPITGKEVSYATKAKRRALAYLGTHLREALGNLLINVAGQIEARPDAKAAALEAFRAPFNPPTTQFIEEAAQAA